MKIAYLNDLHIDSWIKFNNNEHKNRKKIEEFINTITDSLKVKKNV